MRSKSCRAGALALLAWALSGVAAAQVVHSENFETGGLGAYTEVDITPGGGNSLWHGDAFCEAPPPAPSTCFDDVTSAIQAMPFPFSYFGVAKTQFRANSNGWVILNGAGSTAGSFTNTVFPSATGPEDIVCPWWDDQELTKVTSRLTTLLVGAPGSQTLIVEWTDNSSWTGATGCPLNDGSNLTYQAHFYEATGAIEFHYDAATFVAGTVAISASVGAEDATGLVGVDATGLGIANAAFPATDLLLTPGGGTYAVSAIAPSFASIVGAVGAVTLMAASGPLPPNPPTPIDPSFGTNAAQYNRGDEVPPVYTYNTGGINSGAIESPVFAVPANAFDLSVAYDTQRDMENSASFDQCFVEARGAPAAPWGVVSMQLVDADCGSGPLTVTSSGAAATQTLAGRLGGQIRFRVNTVDSVANSTDGWTVDNISVAVAAVPGLLRETPPSLCLGSGGCAPTIGWTGGSPSVSAPGPYAVTLSQALGGAPAILAIGTTNAGLWPFNLGFVLGGGPCYWLNDAGIQLTGFVTSGAAPCEGTVSVPISLAGVPPGGPVYAQWFVVDPGSPLLALPIVGSDQLALTALP